MTFDAQSGISTLVWSEALVVYKKKTRTSERMFKASSFLSMSCFSALPPGFLQVVITHLSMQVILQVLTWRHKTSQKRRCVAVKPLSSGLTCLVTLLNNTDFFFFFFPEIFTTWKILAVQGLSLLSFWGWMLGCFWQWSQHSLGEDMLHGG